MRAVPALLGRRRYRSRDGHALAAVTLHRPSDIRTTTTRHAAVEIA